MGFKKLDNIYFSFFEQIFLKIVQSDVNNSQYNICICFELSNNWRAWTPPQPCNMYCTWIAPCLWKYKGELQQCNRLHCCSEEDSRKGQVLYQEATGPHLPQFYVVIRWGTWIRCSVFLCENLTKSTDAAAIKQVQQLVSNKVSAWLQVLAWCDSEFGRRRYGEEQSWWIY